MTKEEIEQISKEDVVYWIVQNSDDTDAMDKINQVTFPFTSKYQEYVEKREYENSR